MPENVINWNDRQRKAITASGDVLVTAGAGTGKTAVLSQRCVHMVGNDVDGSDVTGMVVLTFTEAAADQMRSRIADALKAAYVSTGDQRFYRQITLLEAADVGTIHSFCRKLISENFHKLGLDPAFGIVDQDEQQLLKAEALESTVRWAWRRDRLIPDLERLLRGRSTRPDRGFITNVIQIHDFLEGVPSRRHWYELVIGGRENRLHTEDLVRSQRQAVTRRLLDLMQRLRSVGGLLEVAAAGAIDTHIESLLGFIAGLLDLSAGNCWDDLQVAVRDFEKPVIRKRRDLDENLASLAAETARDAARLINRMRGLAVIREGYFENLEPVAAAEAAVMAELVRVFEAFYTRAKRSVNCLDFADLERYALKLLVDPETTDKRFVPSPTALSLRRRYRYVLVDECQDINAVQRLIIQSLAAGGNMFMVGDVKQSIYAWRGARPDLFSGMLEEAVDTAGPSAKPLRVDLNENFRSRPAILRFVNSLFKRIMTRSFTGVDYDLNAALAPSGRDPQGDEIAVELSLLDRPDSSQKCSGHIERQLYLVEPRRRQAAMVALRIRQLVGTEMYDRRQGCLRPIRYGDIAILMRSPLNSADDYTQVLRLAGIPVSCPAVEGYKAKTEIADILSVLKVLDNPRRDIELAAVMRSPLFGFTDSQLAKISLYFSDRQAGVDFFDRVAEYSKLDGNRIAEKLKKFLAEIERWRTMGRRGSLADLIWHILNRTRYLSLVLALPNGRQRRADLLKLHDRAIQFENFASNRSGCSLSRFVDFVEKLEDGRFDWSGPEQQALCGDAVRIMSVHKSKGLEFGVVFVAELQGRFNTSSATEDCLAHERHGLGLQLVDDAANTKTPSLAHQVITADRRMVELAEEMRILYVAATRAQNLLILTACEKVRKCLQLFEQALPFSGGPIPDWLLGMAASPLDWILLGLSDRPELAEALGADRRAGNGKDKSLLARVVGLEEQWRLAEEVLPTGTSAGRAPVHGVSAGADQAAATLQRSLSWRYPHRELSTVPAKQSVSQLTDAGEFFPSAMTVSPSGLEAAPAAMLAGSAAHLVLSRLDLSRPVDAAAVECVISALLEESTLSPPLARSIDITAVVEFFRCPVGLRALQAGSRVYREWPFTYALPASDWRGGDGRPPSLCGQCGREFVVVQGIIDMLVLEQEMITVVDFKTDRIPARLVDQRAGIYSPQVRLYARAAAAILGIPSVSTWLYFLSPRVAIEV